MLTLIAISASALAGDPQLPAMTDKTHHLEVTAVLPHPAEAVWAVVADDYGRIAESHPRIVKSDYLHGSLQGALGAERTCWFNDRGSQLLHEQIVAYDAEQMMFQNRVLEAAGFPIDPDNTLATYTVAAIDGDSSRISIVMDYRTDPAFMGGMMAGSFEKLFDDYFVAIDHHLSTGEAVTRDNFKEIARLYR